MPGTRVVTRSSDRPASGSGKRKASTILPPVSTRTSPTRSEQASSDADSAPFTPPDKILPNTGGTYEDWEFHPSRLQALRLELQEDHAEGCSCDSSAKIEDSGVDCVTDAGEKAAEVADEVAPLSAM